MFGSKGHERTSKITSIPGTPDEHPVSQKQVSKDKCLEPPPPSRRQQRVPDPRFEPALLWLPQHY